jgi:hypothetical protein
MKKGGGFKNVTRADGSSSRTVLFVAAELLLEPRTPGGRGTGRRAAAGAASGSPSPGPREPLPREFPKLRLGQERRDGGFVEGGSARALGEGLAEGLGNGIGGLEGGSAAFWRGGGGLRDPCRGGGAGAGGELSGGRENRLAAAGAGRQTGGISRPFQTRLHGTPP